MAGMWEREFGEKIDEVMIEIVGLNLEVIVYVCFFNFQVVEVIVEFKDFFGYKVKFSFKSKNLRKVEECLYLEVMRNCRSIQ